MHKSSGLSAASTAPDQAHAAATGKLKLELPLLLPKVPDVADACVARLINTLAARDGVEIAHVVQPDAGPAMLCIHFDRARISLSRIRQLADSAGARITREIGHQTWRIEGEIHPRRAAILREIFAKVDGILDVGVSASGILRIEHDQTVLPDDAVRARLQQHVPERLVPQWPASSAKASAEPEHTSAAGHHHHGGVFGSGELGFSLAAGGFLALGFAMERLWPGAPFALPLSAYALAYLLGGFFTLREAIDGLRLRRFEIDTLMLVAAIGAAILGAWAEGGLLLFLFSLGHALEHAAMHRAQRAISNLAGLLPDIAMLRHADGVRQVPAASLQPGDVIVVKPHERIAADGFLLSGRSSIDQASITGESIPVDRMAVADPALARANPAAIDAESLVFAGTVNGPGLMEVEVTRPTSQSTLARVVQLINKAETQRSRTERFSARVERVFVPAVLVLATLLLFAWVIIDEPFSASFYRAMAVLVAASPCALAISTPSAVLAGVARAAQAGVLVKGGAPLEELAAVRAIAFDKTGTLTRGKPRIRSVVPLAGVTEAELLSMAVAVESLNDHPLARAIAEDGSQRLRNAGIAPVPTATGIESRPGHGVSAQVDGREVRIGRPETIAGEAEAQSGALIELAQQLRARGETVVAVRCDGRDLGIIGLQDQLRPDAVPAVQALRQLGIGHMVMISGDSQLVAAAIVEDLALDSALGDLLPEDKVRIVLELRQSGGVAMVGDGVNDAPAMASSSVGVAMGAAGSDLALETADIALLGDNLANLPFALELSRKVQRVTRQNLAVSLGMVAFLVPAAILGLGIGPAVVLHEGSTVLVVLNALRLLAHKRSMPKFGSD